MTEDIVEISQLLARYCHAMDRGSVDDIMDAFHREAVLLPRSQSEEVLKGCEAVRSWYENYEKNVRARVRTVRHKISTPMIEVVGNRATSVCYLSADWIGNSGGASQVLGRYEDKLIKDEGRWWIVERAIILEGTYLLGERREL